MSAARRVLPSLFLAFILGASILAVQPVEGVPVSTTQKNLVEGTLEPGAPFQTWQPVASTDTFHLHGPAANGTHDPVAPTSTAAIPFTNVDAAFGGSFQAAALDPPVRFPAITDLTAVDDLQIFTFASTIWAGCTQPSITSGFASIQVSIRATLIRQTPDAAAADGWKDVGNLAAVDLRTAAAISGEIQRYSGTTDVGSLANGGPLVPAGDRMLIQYSASGTPSPMCTMYYDARFPDANGNPQYSQATVKSNALRAAVYPANPSGDLQTGFPPAASTDASGRQFTIEALQAHALGSGMSSALLDRHANVRIYSYDSSGYLYYVDNTGGAPREHNDQAIRLVNAADPDSLVPQPTVETHLGSGVIRRSYVFAYPADAGDHERLEAQFYSQADGWEVKSPPFTLGGRGIEFKVAKGEALTHLINPGEPTEFLFEVRNIGTTDDVVSVSPTDATGGWTARVPGGGRFFLSPGGVAQGTVELVPPAQATSGSQSVTLIASSSFTDVPNPASITFTAQLTATRVSRLDINFTDTNEFNVRPGVTEAFAVTVRNTGTARDSVVVIPSFPSNVQGWSIRAIPSSAQIVAGGTAAIQIQITAPPSATGGFSFPLGLSVVQVGDSKVFDRVDVTVNVQAIEGLLAGVLHGSEHKMREKGPSHCPAGLLNVAGCILPGITSESVPDTDYDHSTLFHLPLTNLGDLPDRLTATASWDTSEAGTQDINGCDGDPTGTGNNGADGIPDGWRWAWASGVGTLDSERQRGAQWYQDTKSGGGIYTLSSAADAIVVPARSTVIVPAELGWILGSHAETACGTAFEPTATQSNTAKLVVTVASALDPTRRQTVDLVAKLEPAGAYESRNRYASARHGVDLMLDQTQPRQVATHLTEGANAVFNLSAFNTGNEQDTVRIAVTGHPDWDHRIVVTGTVPGATPCDAPTHNGSSVVCPNRGVHDRIQFQVVADPGSGVAIGDRDQVTVTVFSGDSSDVFDTLDVTESIEARAAGVLAFAAKALGETSRTVQAGQSVAFPLLIENQGTADDSYRVTVTQGDASWRPVVSTSVPIFIPGGYEAPAFVSVTPPDTTATGAQSQFTVQVESVGSGARRLFQFIGVVIAPSDLRLTAAGGHQEVLLNERGTLQDVAVDATKLSGAGEPITFTVDRASLPDGWVVEDDSIGSTLVSANGGQPKASVTFKVKAPADALGNARAILHVDATTPSQLKAATDIGLSLVSLKGVALEMADNTTQVIAPGGPARYDLAIRNLGLGEDTVELTSSTLPAGWTIVFNPASATLGPLQSLDVVATLTAPVTAKPGDIASVVVFASSAEDPLQISSQVLRAQVGYNALRIEAAGSAPFGAPQETLSRILNVTNTGTLPDQVQVTSRLDTTALAMDVNLTGSPLLFTLLPNQTVQVRSDLTLGPDIPSNATVQYTAIVRSLLDARPVAQRANASLPIIGHVLPYMANDVNGDRTVEYAVDRDRDASNGFEEFKASTTPGATPIQSAQLESFLREDAREAFLRDVTLANGTTQRVLVYTIDGDGDGKTDHFLDRDGDGQPDFYWDADANKASPIGFRKDINGDQVPESFVDTDGDGEQDAVFDLTRGTFTDVIKIDVDGDCQLKDEDGEPLKTAAECLDYVIDKDGDGQVDQDETVLYVRTGGLVIVQKVDVDGDGKLDQVFDTDGDGNPDYFIPAGSTDSVAISMRDLNGDGVQDWTFDGDNDGRKESYYDPVTGKAHVIDAAGNFVDALKKYWYVGALFALVVVLFAALVLVTRR